MKKFLEIIRAIDPIQPLTIGVWWTDVERLSEIQKYGLENSDIISYHNYNPYENNIRELKLLKKLGRPILNTEWLARCNGNTVEEMFPLFYLENVGCYNWGFVAGKYQTYEPYNGTWTRYKNNPAAYDKYDFTKWFHDLFRPSLNPYNPKEITIIKRYCDLADKDFNEKDQ